MSRQMSFEEAANTVKLSLDIVDIVGRHVAIRRAGRNFTGLCPFHPEKTPSFYVHPEKQLYKCFGCGEGGDALSFLMKVDNKTYPEVITDLAEDQGIEIIRTGGGRTHTPKSELEILYQLQEEAQQYYQNQLTHAPSVKAYLDERQIAPTWQTAFGLGYAPAGWENLVNHLKQKLEPVRTHPAVLEKAGLANIRSETSGYYDRFRNRLMIPIHDDRGRIVAFGGRSLSPEDQPKYLNSPETPIYVKNRVLYGLSQARESIRSARYAILMEGYFDVISAHMAGITQAVGVCGTALTEHHLKLLQRAGAERLYLCFDADDAGQTAALRAIDLVQHQLLEQGVSLKVILLPGEKDPDDFLKTQGKDRFMACLDQAQDFLTFKFSKALSSIPSVETAEGRIQAVQAITPILLEIHQPVIRHEHVKHLAERIGIREETLLLELKQAENRNQPYGYKKSQFGDAISGMSERYKGRKRWGTSPARPRPEDIRAFRKHLSDKIPIEDKEHLLVSYLFVNDESYRLVMNLFSQLDIQSPQAKAFLQHVCSLEGRWDTLDDLVHQLSAAFHADDNHDMLQFLAHRVMVVDEILQSAEHSGRGLKSMDHREKLNRDIHDIVQKIQLLREQAALNTLAQDGKHHEQQADDQTALQIQLQLREELKARKRVNTIGGLNQTGSVTSQQHSQVFKEEEQGV